MRTLVFAIVSFAFLNVCVAQDASESGVRPQVSTRLPGPEPTPEEIQSLVDQADATELLSVGLRYPPGLRLSHVRERVNELGLLRVLASVSNGFSSRPVSLGEFYDEEKAWNHSICQLFFLASIEGDGYLLSMPPERWPVHEIRALGTAANIREFMTSSDWPAAELVDANTQPSGAMARFAEIVRKESDRPLYVRDGYPAPAFCQPFMVIGE